MAYIEILLGFLISLAISTIVIYVATKLFGEKKGLDTAVTAAVCGAVIWAIASYFTSQGWIALLIGGIAWIIALGSLYKIGWIKSFLVTVVIWVIVVWVFAFTVSIMLPTIAGPL